MTETAGFAVIVGVLIVAWLVEISNVLFWKARADYWLSRANTAEGLAGPAAPIWRNTWQHPHGHAVRIYVSLEQFETDVRELVIARRDARGGTDGR